MTESEQAIHNARIAWNALSKKEREVIVRWLALSPSRELFCQIVQSDGNCPMKKFKNEKEY